MANAKSIVATLENVNANAFENEAERALARDAIYAAYYRIQTPWEIAATQGWTEV